ncbi:tyrosinase-like [Branchiostoma lanceolatum]|uniref:tyrosinase-like n=1 Tax=Branchiostoma lanceolatum TaxID=7740 RepID=UPI0034525D60
MRFADPNMKALGLLIVLWGCFHGCAAQFPRVCISKILLDSKECCPIPLGFTEPCGGPGRGHCADTPDPTVEDPAWKNINAYKVDDRRHWPTVFFTRTCMCVGNFSGYDCSKCKWGHRGENCDTKQQPDVRRNIKDLSTEEKNKFQRYFDRAKNTPSDFVFALEFKDNTRGSEDFANISVYDYFVAVHYHAGRETLPPFSTGILFILQSHTRKTAAWHNTPVKPSRGQTPLANILPIAGVSTEEDCFLDFAHQGAGFLTWHRAYLLEFEQALREVNSDPDWTLPYWDWAAAEDHQCDICTNEYVGANDEDGDLDPGSVFASWWTICEDEPPFDDATQTNHTVPCNVTRSLSLLFTSPSGRLMRNPGMQDPIPFGASVTHLPLATEVDFALRFPVFDTPPYDESANCSFRNLLEGYADTSTGKARETITYDNGTTVPESITLHNQVHLYLNGTMTAVSTAPNDPIFFLHHCNVDRLFESWIRRHGTPTSALPEKGAPPGQSRHDHIVPFFPPYRHADMFKPSTELGYDYQELYHEELDGGSDLGECSAAPSEGVSLALIGMGVALGLVVVVTGITVLLFIRFGHKQPQYHAANTEPDMPEVLVTDT